VKYYSAGGLSLGENTATSASGISYLASDGLGSVSEALNQTGTATGSMLYGPYGGVRYTSGTMPTAKGFTGQYGDASTGLDYYGARYYDPALGQFTSADTVDDGLNRYAYVHGNPETDVDPSGNVDIGDAWEALAELVGGKQTVSNVLTALGLIIQLVIPFTPPPPNGPNQGPRSGYSASTSRTTNDYQTNGAYQGGAAKNGGNDAEPKLADNLGGNNTGNSGNSRKGGGRGYGRPQNQRGKPLTNTTRTGNPQRGYKNKSQNALVSGAAVSVHSIHNTWDFDFGYTGSTGTSSSSSTSSTSNWWDGITSTARNIGTGIGDFFSGVGESISNVHVSVGPIAVTGVVAVLVFAGLVVLA
jgi:RHS repeat-associated protein